MPSKALLIGAVALAAASCAWLWSTSARGLALPRVEAAAPGTRAASTGRAEGNTELLQGARRAGTTEVVLPALPESVAELSLEVVLHPSGRPLSGVRLVAYEAGVPRASRSIEGHAGDLTGSPTSDALGRARFALPAGRPLRLSLRGAGAGAQDTTLTLAPFVDGEERHLVVRLEARPDVVVLGVVIDRESGAPIAGAELRARAFEPGREAGRAQAWSAIGDPAVVTNERGRFELSGPAGERQTYQVDAAGYGPALLRLGHEADGPERTLTLARAASLIVQVRGGQLDQTQLDQKLFARLSCTSDQLAIDQGLPGGPELEWLAPVSTDGRALLSQLPAGVALTLELRQGDALLRSRAQPVVLDPGAEQTLTLELGRGLRLSGQLATSEGTPIPDQELWLIPTRRRGAASLASRRALRAVHARTRTDGEGRYRIEDVPAGEWCLGPAPPLRPNEQALAPIGRWFRAPLGAEELTLDLVAQRGSFLRGRILGTDGEPAACAPLTYRTLDGDAPVHAQADEAGEFRLGPVGPGPYELTALPNERLGHCGSEPLVAVPGDASLELRLRSGVTLTLSGLREDNGRLVPLVRALVTRRGGASTLVAAHHSAQGQAALRLGPLEPGLYAVAVATHDGLHGLIPDLEVRAGATPPQRLVPLAPGARLVLQNRAAQTQSIRVLSGGAVVAALTVEPGEETTVQVPSGEVQVEADGDEPGLRELRLQLHPGGSTRVALPLVD